MNDTEQLEVADEIVDAAPELRHELATTEYATVLQGLTAIRKRLADVAYDVKSVKGMGEAKADRYSLVKLRTSLEAKRKQIKEPALQRSRDIDSVAAAIEAEIRKVEEPIDQQIKAEEERKAAEREAERQRAQARVDALQREIAATRAEVMDAIGEPSAAIAERLLRLRSAEVDEERFGEFATEAKIARLETIEALSQMQTQAVERERMAAEAAIARKREAEDLAERNRLAREQADRDAEQRRTDDAERERLRAENQRLRDEADQRERQARAETEARAQREREEQEAREQQARAEQEERDRAERERIAAQAAREEQEREAERIVMREREAAERRAQEQRDAQTTRIIAAPGRMRALLLRVIDIPTHLTDAFPVGLLRDIAAVLGETDLQEVGAAPKRGPGRPRKT